MSPTDILAKENPTSDTGLYTISLNKASDKVTTIPFTVSMGSPGAALPNSPDMCFPRSSVSGPDYTLTRLCCRSVHVPHHRRRDAAGVDDSAKRHHHGDGDPGLPEGIGANEQVVITLGTPSNANGAVRRNWLTPKLSDRGRGLQGLDHQDGQPGDRRWTAHQWLQWPVHRHDCESNASR